jgi:hypothetical protein
VTSEGGCYLIPGIEGSDRIKPPEVVDRGSGIGTRKSRIPLRADGSDGSDGKETIPTGQAHDSRSIKEFFEQKSPDIVDNKG